MTNKQQSGPLPKFYNEKIDCARLRFCAVTDHWPLRLREEKRRSGRNREGLRRGGETRRGSQRRAGDQSRALDRGSPDARQRPYDPSPRQSGATEKIARKRSGESYISRRQVYWNRLGRRYSVTRRNRCKEFSLTAARRVWNSHSRLARRIVAPQCRCRARAAGKGLSQRRRLDRVRDSQT